MCLGVYCRFAKTFLYSQRRAVRAFAEWITSELSRTDGKSKKRGAVDR
jgi:hypothetical protein